MLDDKVDLNVRVYERTFDEKFSIINEFLAISGISVLLSSGEYF